MNYKEALDYLYYKLPMFQRQGKKAFKKDLSNINQLLDLLGRPEKSFKSIHIAGSNGKGTTAHIIAALLQANGLKVGMYTSPHYKDFRERIKINGQLISRNFVRHFVEKIKRLIEQHDIKPSFFEITVAMAFAYFENSKPDIAVIETGLGGRLDSTNVINPEVCLITNISLDHVAFLGNTLPLIAQEKAGIIKPNTPVVIGERQGEVEEVFIKAAIMKGAQIKFAELNPLAKQFSRDPFFQNNVNSSLAVYYELANVIQLDTNDKFIIKAIDSFEQKTYYLGRWQVLGEEPKIIADSAHNVGGLTKVLDHMSSLTFERLHIVFGMVDDKDPSQVYALLPRTAKYYFVAADIPRAKAASNLCQDLTQLGLNGKAYKSVAMGLAMAKRTAKPQDLILIIGSIFVVAEII